MYPPVPATTHAAPGLVVLLVVAVVGILPLAVIGAFVYALVTADDDADARDARTSLEGDDRD